MAILVKYRVDVDHVDGEQISTQSYYFLANPNTYLNLGTVTGIKRVTNANELNQPNTTVAELLGAGILLRINAHGKSANNKSRSFYVLALRSRAGVVQDNLLGKTIQSVKITSVSGRRKATFY
jgi:hypothetical protein